MPTYNYKCGSCNHEFDKLLPVDDRRLPESMNCPNCDGENTVFLKVGAPSLGYGINRTLKTSENFNDRLKQIKENVPTAQAKDNINSVIR